MSSHYIDCDTCGEEIGSTHPGYLTRMHPECKPFTGAMVLSIVRLVPTDTPETNEPLEIFSQRELEDEILYSLEFLIFDLREQYKKPFTTTSFPKGGM